MKKVLIITLIFMNTLFLIPTKATNKKMTLNGLTIVIDPGHGYKDNGTSYLNINEKDINLNISLYLKTYLESYGVEVYLTRDADYDLSTPNTNKRKKSDFNNRIKFINDLNPDLVISIHQNYYSDSKYNGTQIFYKDCYDLSNYLQNNINSFRQTKPIDSSLYMYNKIFSKVLLIECGFLSNKVDRNNLITKSYQDKYAKELSFYIKEYYINN